MFFIFIQKYFEVSVYEFEQGQLEKMGFCLLRVRHSVRKQIDKHLSVHIN